LHQRIHFLQHSLYCLLVDFLQKDVMMKAFKIY
jgi:hypothetical protein